jgi:hypothetical protein
VANERQVVSINIQRWNTTTQVVYFTHVYAACIPPTFVPLGQDPHEILHPVWLGEPVQEGHGGGGAKEGLPDPPVEEEGVVEGVVRIDVQVRVAVGEVQVADQVPGDRRLPDRDEHQLHPQRLELLRPAAPLDDELLAEGSAEAPQKDDDGHTGRAARQEVVHCEGLPVDIVDDPPPHGLSGVERGPCQCGGPARVNRGRRFRSRDGTAAILVRGGSRSREGRPRNRTGWNLRQCLPGGDQCCAPSSLTALPRRPECECHGPPLQRRR